MAPVGNVGRFSIDRRDGTCEVAVGIMAPERRGKGLGTEATRLITGYAIRDLGMHNVHLATLAFNLAGIRAYQKAGFREYGWRREAWLHNGRRWDIVFSEAATGVGSAQPRRTARGRAVHRPGRPAPPWATQRAIVAVLRLPRRGRSADLVSARPPVARTNDRSALHGLLVPGLSIGNTVRAPRPPRLGRARQIARTRMGWAGPPDQSR